MPPLLFSRRGGTPKRVSTLSEVRPSGTEAALGSAGNRWPSGTVSLPPGGEDLSGFVELPAASSLACRGGALSCPPEEPASSAKTGCVVGAPRRTTIVRTQNPIFKPLSSGVVHSFGGAALGVGCGAARAPPRKNVCNAGTTTRSMIGPMNMPPTTTVASGRCT